MSDLEQKTNRMRSLIIHAPEGESVIELLKKANIDGWEWSETGFPSGAHQHCLRKGNEFIAVSFESDKSDRARSSNVMPYDSQNDPEGANKLINQLSNALTDAEIDNSVIASVNDRTS